MTEKEKATELFKKYYCMSNSSKSRVKVIEFETAKKCALIAVDEIIDALKITTGHCELRRLDLQEVQSDFDYWGRVKQEIEKL